MSAKTLLTACLIDTKLVKIDKIDPLYSGSETGMTIVLVEMEKSEHVIEWSEV